MAFDVNMGLFINRFEDFTVENLVSHVSSDYIRTAKFNTDVERRSVKPGRHEVQSKTLSITFVLYVS